MITLRYKVQTLNQTEEGGEPIGALVLVPIVEAPGESSTSSRALSPAPVRPPRQSAVPFSGIPLNDLVAESLRLGDTVVVTVSKEQG